MHGNNQLSGWATMHSDEDGSQLNEFRGYSGKNYEAGSHIEVTCLFRGKLNKCVLRMMRPSGVLSLLVLLLAPSLVAQSPSLPKPSTPKADNSQEAFVVEQFTCKERFENDGTSSQEVAARVRIQSEAGVQQYGVLSFSYASGTGTFDVGSVRVRKPDGSVVETPPENVQDMASQITREAPFYSDLHEKHVAVKGLGVGDVLEYQTKEHTTKPLAPGHFWTAYGFAHDWIVLDEQLEMSVPRERVVKIKSTTVQPAIREADGYRIYTWHSTNLQHKDATNEKREATEKVWQQGRGRFPQPDVLMSSFASWEEVARWYEGLQAERVKPTPEVTAKAAELTKSATNDEAKMRALYGYVSTQFHYIGIAFGIGRYQPHSSGEVLANQYGDCKDKHTLLASLLTSVGIPAYPALISGSREVEQDVPSPGQFDHVITVVPREGGLVWLDATAEVGPYQYLLPNLRDKHALAIWKDKPAALVDTPADLPYASAQKFNIDAKLSDAGTLEGHADFYARGDIEYVLRSGFRAVPLPQWKELGQRISISLGFGGEVSEVTASSPERTDEPFHFAYKYTRKEFGDWANRRTLAAEPLISLTASRDEELLPLGPTWLGPPTDIQFTSKEELPAGYRPELPAAIHWKRDFAEYDATYAFKDGKLISERHLKTLLQEAPVSEREAYKQLVKTMEDDYGQFIPLTSGSGSVMASGNASSGISSLSVLGNLPDSSNEEATRLESEAREAMAKKDPQSAVSSLYRAVSADPKFTRAWLVLGSLLLMQKQKDAGIDAFHKAMATDPEQAAIPKALGFGLMANSQFEEAVPVWQDFIKAHPDDGDGPGNLGNCFVQLKRYSEAATQYESAMKIGGNRPNLEASLGSAYLLAGEREKAVAAFGKLGDTDTEGNTFNDVAYEMANADLQLPLALKYAKRAVRATEEESQRITLSDLKVEDLKRIFKVAAYWDTLGWVNERMSNLEEAEQYLQASWKLTQDGVVAGHLCHLYERVHKVGVAIQMCRMAVNRMSMSQQLALSQYRAEMDAAQKNLDHLTVGMPKSKSPSDASDLAIRERQFKLPRFLPGTESAEFFVLLGSDGKSKNFKVEDVKFISGSDKMKLQGKQLKSIDFDVPAPDDIPTRFVRRGILGCYEYTGCSFVLLDPASATSLN
jgi:tetratricopeptide (TPR) repeat protein/transglutaminase-like putative cysteine protease